MSEELNTTPATIKPKKHRLVVMAAMLEEAMSAPSLYYLNRCDSDALPGTYELRNCRDSLSLFLASLDDSKSLAEELRSELNRELLRRKMEGEE